jgi:hypothetical protein
MTDTRSLRAVVAALTVMLGGCGGGDLKNGLAGTWLVTRTLLTEVPGLPKGYYDQQQWSFTVAGDQATMGTAAGNMQGQWRGSSWYFDSGQYADPRTGQPAQTTFEAVGVDPLKGGLETKLFDPTGLRPPTSESFTVEGSRIR